jgi:hypothetical protein
MLCEEYTDHGGNCKVALFRFHLETMAFFYLYSAWDPVFRLSMLWQQRRLQRGQRRRVHFFQEAAARRTAYLPHGSVQPHRLHRTTQPGARRSYDSINPLADSSDMVHPT